MDNTEKENLIKQIFASELDYREIQKRLDTETDPKVRTDYEKKLQHDRDVVGIWIQKLKSEGIANLNDAARKAIRQAILDGLKNRESKEESVGIDWINGQMEELNKKRIITEGEKKLNEDFKIYDIGDKITQEDYDFQVTDLQNRLAIKQKRLAILDELKLMTKNIWQQ